MGRKLQQESEISTLAGAMDEALKAKGYSYRELEAAAGVDKGQISRIMSGQFRTISTNLQRICNVLGLDPNDYSTQSSKIPAELLVQLERGWVNSGTQRQKYEEALLALARLF